MLHRPFVAVAFALALGACFPVPPAGWAAGGAHVDLPRARWVYGDTTVEIGERGELKVNGDPQFGIDTAGRVFDADNTPVALLLSDGRVVGPNQADLGFVGQSSASLPGDKRAWLTLLPSGEVVRYDDDADRHALGTWSPIDERGCDASPRARQVCVLVTHLFGMKLRSGGFAPGTVSFGFGIGVGR